MKTKLPDSTMVCLFVIMVLLAMLVQQSLALHQAWKNERTLSQSFSNLKERVDRIQKGNK
jgi:hypothetical protein